MRTLLILNENRQACGGAGRQARPSVAKPDPVKGFRSKISTLVVARLNRRLTAFAYLVLIWPTDTRYG